MVDIILDLQVFTSLKISKGVVRGNVGTMCGAKREFSSLPTL